MQPSEEIKLKLDIVDFIRDYVPLRPAGMNFRANCPFHREKTPSFMVSPDKQIWHCFGCGKGGDIFAFVMEMENVDFVEALRILAPKAGVTLRREDPKLQSQRNRILDILELSRRYYHKVLREGPSAKAARQYLEKRGLTEETIEEWQIGYSPDEWENVSKLLKQKGFSENEIFLSGMSVKSEKSAGFYDRFRGRIMFPINDINGNTIAFTARTSPEKEATEKMGKYINSPQTQVYDKSKVIFGLDKAKQAIKLSDLAIMVEGQMDVITAHQAGYRNVIAASGTALTADQIAMMKRYSPNIAMAFDMDEAGKMAADRGIREASAAEMNIKVVKLPAGKDPDECIRADREGWEKAIREAKPMMEHYFAKIFESLDLESAENRRQGARQMLPIIAMLGNKIEKDIWLKKLAEKINVSESVLRESLPQARHLPARPSDEKAGQTPENTARQNETREEKISGLLIALVIKFPDISEYITGRLQMEEIAGEANKLLYKDLVFYYNNVISEQAAAAADNNDSWLKYKEFQPWLEQQYSDNRDRQEIQLKLLEQLVFLGDSTYDDYESSQIKSEAIILVQTLKKHFFYTRMREIEKMLEMAEKEHNEGRMKELMEEFRALSEELALFD